MKNKILYWIITCIWIFIVAFYIVLGLFIDSILGPEGKDQLQWLFDLYKLFAFILCGCITFLLLGMLIYHTFFHLAYLLCASLAIAAFLFDIYFRYTYEENGGSFLVAIGTLLLHLFVFNTTKKNLSAFRVQKGLAPLSFL